MKRKLLSVLLTLGMIVCLCGALTLMSYAKTSEVGSETDLTTALSTADVDEIKLTANITLSNSIIIGEGKTVTIDLNGHVLTGNGTSSVITNSGNLTIEDGNSEKVHYFNYVKDGAWTLNTTAFEGIDVREINSDTADDIVIKVCGGVITGKITNEKCPGCIDNNGTLTVNGGNFVGCDVTYRGVIQNRGKLYLNKGNFFGNRCSEGVAVFNRNGEAFIGRENGVNSDVLIEYNTAKRKDGTSFGSGGGLSNIATKEGDGDDTAKMTVYCCTIKHNKAQNGGAIFNYVVKDKNNDEGKSATLTIYDCIIDSNEATNDGGGIYNGVEKSIGTATVNCIDDETEISNNKAGQNGGGIYNFGDFNMEYGKISENESVGNGGGIKNDGIFTMTYCTVSNNKAVSRTKDGNGGNGGGIRNDGKFTMTNCIVSENQANLGGGIYSNNLFISEESSVSENKAVISKNSPLDGGQAQAIIGGVYNDGGIFIMRGGSISENSAVMIGGLLNEGGKFVMNGGYITDNTATDKVGGVAQLGIMYLGGESVIKNNTEGEGESTVASNLFLTDLSTQTKTYPIILGIDTEVTLIDADKEEDKLKENISKLKLVDESSSNIGITFASNFNSTTFEFTKGFGEIAEVPMDYYDLYTVYGTFVNTQYFFSDIDIFRVVFAGNILQVADRIQHIPKDSSFENLKGFIPESNIDEETAKKLFDEYKERNNITDKDYNTKLIYSKTNGRYKCLSHSNGKWETVHYKYGEDLLKEINEGNVYVLGSLTTFCKTTTEGLREGDEYRLVVDGTELGSGFNAGPYYVFTITKTKNGYWVFQDKFTSEYLSYNASSRSFYSSLSACEFKLDSNGLYTEVTRTVRTRILFFYRTTKITEKVYVAKDVKLVKYYDSHKYSVYQIPGDEGENLHLVKCVQCGIEDKHNHVYKNDVCYYCGYEQNKIYAIRGINLDISTKITSYKLADILRGTNKSYIVKISPYGDEGIYAKTIEYRINGGEWKTGSTFVSSTALFDLDVKVTDNKGTVSEWYDVGTYNR